MLGQEVECKAKEPTGHFLTISSPAFEPSELGEGVCNHNMLIAGWGVVLPSDPLHPLGRPRVESHLTGIVWELHAPYEGWVEHPVDYAQGMGKWEAVEICLGLESLGISLAGALEVPRCWVHVRGMGSNLGKGEVGKSAEATQGRCCCKLLRALGDHRTAIRGFETTNENIETACSQVRIDVGERQCREVVQSRQTDGSV